MLIDENRPSKIFWSRGIFFHEFGFENGCKNEFKDNNKNHAANPERESLKIDFEAVWPHRGHADSV